MANGSDWGENNRKHSTEKRKAAAQDSLDTYISNDVLDELLDHMVEESKINDIIEDNYSRVSVNSDYYTRDPKRPKFDKM